MGAIRKRKQIVTWYAPDEKRPPREKDVIITFSGTTRRVIFDHALGIAQWWETAGIWAIEGVTLEESEKMKVHAWADLERYEGSDV